LSVNPNWLIIVEGINYGADLTGVATNPVVLSLSNKLVYSAHTYSLDVYYQSVFYEPNFPDNLRAYWTNLWGYVAVNKIAPLYLGEFGVNFAYASDVPWLTKLINFLNGQYTQDGVSSLAAGDQGISWTFWDVNPESYGTGGILKADWITVESTKLSYIQSAQSPITDFQSPSSSPIAQILSPSPSLRPPSPSTPSGSTSFGYYSTRGNQIIDQNGNTVRIAGINWY
jgi:aryl-phospho-beta-D-glucosidase BglC (GH1 family)